MTHRLSLSLLAWALASAALAQPQTYALDALGRTWTADRLEPFQVLGDTVEVRGFGNLWTQEPSYDLRAPGAEAVVRARARVACEPDEGGEFMLGFSQSRVPWGRDGVDALSFRIGCDPKDGFHDVVRSGMYAHFLSTGRRRVGADEWFDVELRLRRDRLRVWLDGRPIQDVALREGDVPLFGHVGILGYRRPRVQVAALEIEGPVPGDADPAPEEVGEPEPPAPCRVDPPPPEEPDPARRGWLGGDP